MRALITTPFGSRSTADEVIAGHDLTGRRAVVTGASSGVGVETARSLARAGAEVTLAVRNTAAGTAVAQDIIATTGNHKVLVQRLELANRASVRAFTTAWSGPLHLLVNNAGIMALPELTLTPEGWELQFATNHLGHFALTVGLHRALATADGSRIVSVSSAAHLGSPVFFDDLFFERRPYDPGSAYAQSKTANVLLAVEATRRWADDGIVANALMPGSIPTGLQRHIPPVADDCEQIADGRVKNTCQGAATSIVAAVHPGFEDGGCYLEDCNEARTVANDASDHTGVKEWALDPAAAVKLWALSTELLDT